MKIVSIIFMMLVSATAMADFNGTWRGTGTAVDATGAQFNCTQMTMTMTQSPSVFQFQGATFNCSGLTINMTPATFQLQGDEVFSSGSEVGSATETEFHVSFTQGDSTDNYDMSITAGALQFQQLITSDGYYLLIQGTFSN